MNAPTVWDLIQQERFDEACIRADDEFQEGGSLLVLRNKIFALLQLGRLDEAIALSERIIGLNKGNTDSDFIFLGVARWLQKQHGSAVAAWKAGLHTTYTDAAGGLEIPLLLLFAAIRTQDASLKNETVKLIEKLGKSKKMTNWPGPLGRYMIGRISEEELVASISNQPIVRAKQECQADFYFAVNRLTMGDWVGYRAKLKACISHGAASYVKQELYLARAEFGSSELGSISNT